MFIIGSTSKSGYKTQFIKEYALTKNIELIYVPTKAKTCKYQLLDVSIQCYN